jgi:hypothetical protein
MPCLRVMNSQDFRLGVGRAAPDTAPDTQPGPTRSSVLTTEYIISQLLELDSAITDDRG